MIRRAVSRRLGPVLLSRYSTSRAPSQHHFTEENFARYAPGGYHPVRLGDKFSGGRYDIVCKLGYGLYSTVWLAFDQKEKRHLALKILTADSYDGKHDTFELNILKNIRSRQSAAKTGGTDQQSILGLVDDFAHVGPHGEHVCLVFEATGPDMSIFRSLFPRACIPLPLLKSITRQLLAALAFLHDTCKVIHCDIKPQNLLVTTPSITSMFSSLSPDAFPPDQPPLLPPPDDFYMESTQILSAEEDLARVSSVSVKLADFGTSSWFDKHLTEHIQPQMLRAPEVILGAPWDHKVDIWNLGLIIWEFAQATLVFDGTWTARAPYSSGAHLAQMQAVLGSMPASLLDRAGRRGEFFRDDGSLREPSPFPHTPLASILRNPPVDGDAEEAAFLDFIASMIRLEPRTRPNARELLDHEWLQ